MKNIISVVSRDYNSMIKILRQKANVKRAMQMSSNKICKQALISCNGLFGNF